MKNRPLFKLEGAMAFVLMWFFVAQAAGLTSIEKATHVIRGTIESTEVEWAGGLIPITHVNVRVKDVMKNSDRKLAPDNKIQILLYGCETETGIMQTSNEKHLIFKLGQEMLVPLKKYYKQYRLFDLNDPFALTYINKNNKAKGYDDSFKNEKSGGNKNDANNMKEQYYQRQQQEFMNREPMRKEHMRIAFSTDKMVRKSKKSLRIEDFDNSDYLQEMISEKAKYSAVNAATGAFSIVKVSIKGIRETNGAIELLCKTIKTIKGKSYKNEILVYMPSVEALDNKGWLLPETGESGILLLDKKDFPIDSPDFFIKEINGEYLMGTADRISAQELLPLLTKEN